MQTNPDPYAGIRPPAVIEPDVTIALGIDLSLTSTGLTAVGTRHVTTCLEKSKGKQNDSIDLRGRRLRNLAERITYDHVPNSDQALIVIEQPAYSRTTGSHHDRSGLWWMVVSDFQHLGWKVVEVAPGTLKTYATGRGVASKDQVLASVVKRYPDVDVTDNNVADSLILAAMGARQLGHPIEDSLPAKNLTAMDKVRWPA